MEYYVWEALAGKDAAVLTDLQNYEGVVDIKRGRKLTGPLPDDAFFEMNPRYPKDIFLEEQISNMDKMVLVSPKFSEFLVSENLSGIEYLPVNIKDHKGVLSKERYQIVHSTKVIDCIDKSNSDLLWNKIDPSFLSGCYELVLNEERIKEEDVIFRLKHLETFLIVREDLVEKINRAGFSGVDMTNIDEFES